MRTHTLILVRNLIYIAVAFLLVCAGAVGPPATVARAGLFSGCGPLDVALAIDVTNSMGRALANVKAQLPRIIEETERASDGDYRLALVTFDDAVTVNQAFVEGNKDSIAEKIATLTASGGNGIPEASDEALAVIVNGLRAQGRAQQGDFDTPFREHATKVVVLITDAAPGGFHDAFTPGVDDRNAAAHALEARDKDIKIAAVFVPTGGGDPAAREVMRQYAALTGGRFVETAANGQGAGKGFRNVIGSCGAPPGFMEGLAETGGDIVDNWPLILGAVLLGLGAGWYLWRKRQEQQKTLATAPVPQEPLPVGAVPLRAAEEPWARIEGNRQIAFALVGTLGARLGPKVLRTLVRAGGEKHVSVIYLCEMDLDEREAARLAIPDILRDRLVVCESTLYPVGFEGARYEDVEADYRHWKHDVEGRAQDACDVANTSAERPAILIVIGSAGGHAAVTLPIVRTFAGRFRLTTYCITAMPDDPAQRQDFPVMLTRWWDSQLIRGVLLADNWNDAARNDQGICWFVASLVGGTWLSDRPLAGWNMLPKLFARQPGQQPVWIATLSTWWRDIPVKHHPGLPPQSYTYSDKVVEGGLDGYEAVQEEQYKALRLSAPAAGTRRYFYYVAPVIPPDLRQAGERIQKNLGLDPQRESFNMVSLGMTLTPETETALVGMVLVEAVESGLAKVTALARGEPVPAPVAVPIGNGTAPTPAATPAGNGAAPETATLLEQTAEYTPQVEVSADGNGGAR